MAIFRFFKMVAAAILYFQNFKFLTVGQLKRVEVSQLQNLVEIGRNAAEIWRFVDFSRWRPPPSWIFKNFKFLTVGQLKWVEMRRRAKFG